MLFASALALAAPAELDPSAAPEPWSLVGLSARDPRVKAFVDAHYLEKSKTADGLRYVALLDEIELTVADGVVRGVAVKDLGAGSTPLPLPFDLAWTDREAGLLARFGPALHATKDHVWRVVGGRCDLAAWFHPDAARPDLGALTLTCGREALPPLVPEPVAVDAETLERAKGAWNREEFTQAWNLYRAVVEADPAAFEADFGLTRTLFRLNRPTEAATAGCAALSRGRKDASSDPWLARLDETLRDRAVVCPDTAPAPAVAAAPAAPAPVVVAPAPPRPDPLPSIDAPARTSSAAPQDVGVVVGLEDYAFVADVPFARRDADAFYDFLVYTRGVPQARVQRLTSGSREHVLAAVERAAAEVGPGGTVWVYFSGHGAANPSTGERMLLGDDVRADAVAFSSRGVDVKQLEALASAHGGQPMLVLDTCYSGAGRRGESLLGGTRFAVPPYATAPTAGAQWNAAAPDQISGPLEPVGHGAFTYFAVGALRGWADGERDHVRDGVVTAEEAQLYVTRALRAHGQNGQTPVWLGPADRVLSHGTEQGPAF